MPELPYFDLLFEGKRRGDPAAKVFEKHVHWGFWPSPLDADGTPEDFARAMARLDDEVIAGARLGDGMTVADVGCGFGGTLARLSQRFPKSRLVGVNWDLRQLQAVQPSRASFARGDACALPLKADSFDAVLAVECIFHFPSRFGFLREAARVLKKGGRLTLSDFVPASLGAQSGPLGRFVERRIAAGYGGVSSGWPEGGYADMARKAGLVVERDFDGTVHTLPTYPFLLKLINARGFGGPEKMLWPTRWLRLVSQLRAVKYRFLSFRK